MSVFREIGRKALIGNDDVIVLMGCDEPKKPGQDRVQISLDRDRLTLIGLGGGLPAAYNFKTMYSVNDIWWDSRESQTN